MSTNTPMPENPPTVPDPDEVPDSGTENDQPQR